MGSAGVKVSQEEVKCRGEMKHYCHPGIALVGKWGRRMWFIR